ncbi:MAG: hypothetical protein ACLUHN_09390 [Evtepia gabavorous]
MDHGGVRPLVPAATSASFSTRPPTAGNGQLPGNGTAHAAADDEDIIGSV